MQRIGIIGAGRFGVTLATSLAELGGEVVLMDCDREKIKRFSGDVAKAVEGDATAEEALRQAGFSECDAVVVCIGANMEASILATITLKEIKARYVIAKAISEMHGKVLERVGADRVIYLNREMARRVARSLMRPGVLGYFEVSDGVGIMEIKAPRRMIGKTLAQAKIRNVLGLTVLSLTREADAAGKTEKIVAPGGEVVINKGDNLAVFGPDKNLEKLREQG